MDKHQVIETLSQHKKRLNEMQVEALSLFGSVARGEAGSESDVDILVEFKSDAKVGLFELVRLKRFISDILECNADLVTPDALHPMMKDHILRERISAA